MVNFAKIYDKYLANIQHYFAKSLAKFPATFTIILWNICQIFSKNLIQQLINQYNSDNVGRMIYFRETSIVTLNNKKKHRSDDRLKIKLMSFQKKRNHISFQN